MTFPMLADEIFRVMSAGGICRLAAGNGIGFRDIMNLSRSGAEKYAAAMEKENVRSGCYIENISCFLDREKRKKRFAEAAEKSAVMGGDRIMLLPTGNGDGKRMTAMGRDACMNLLAEYFTDAVEIAGKRNTLVTFENTGCGFSLMQKSGDILELCSRVSGLGLAFDMGLPLTCGQDPFDFYTEVKSVTRHVHVRDASVAAGGRGIKTCAYGLGVVPLEKLRGALAADGYGGLYALEYCRPPGLLCGPAAHGAFLKKFRWFFDGLPAPGRD